MGNVMKKVTLEPELEEIAGGMSAAQCMEMARIYERWARQLRVKARIMMASDSPVSRPAHRPPPRRRLPWN
jgi:hypothetical protein